MGHITPSLDLALSDLERSESMSLLFGGSIYTGAELSEMFANFYQEIIYGE